MATFLLRHEADRSTKMKNDEGLDALGVADQFGRRDMMELLSPESLQLLQMIKTEAKTLCQSIDDGLLSAIMDSIDNHFDQHGNTDTADSPSAPETTDFVAPPSPMVGGVDTHHLSDATDNEGVEGADGHSGHDSHLEIDFFSEDIVKMAPPAPADREEEVAVNRQEAVTKLLTRFQTLCGQVESDRVRSVYKEMIRLEANRMDLRVLESWIEEKDTEPPHQFSMRWVVVKV